MRKLTTVAPVLWLLIACVGTARADDPGSDVPPERIQRLSDSEVSERLHFLEERLDSGSDYAWWWWHGWTAFYGLAAAVQGIRAGLEHDNDARKAEYVISAVKATGGTIVLLLRPLAGQEGADAVRALPDSSPEDRRRQLVVAETLLHTKAEVSLRRYSWLRHLLNIGINAAGGVIIAQGFDDPSRGARTAGIGAAVGEISLLSQPWWPADDWEEYERRFDAATAPRVTWRVVPTIGGAMVQVDF